MKASLTTKPVFKNREEAAHLLTAKLLPFQLVNPLILAIPRGGVPLGAILAKRLNGELDVLTVHKIAAPKNPEHAIGAVSEGGILYRSPYPQHLWVPVGYIEAEMERQSHLLQQRRRLYTPHRDPISATNRMVVIVDDGIATGSTMMAAIHEVERQNPTKTIVASAVAPPEALKRLRAEADETVILTLRSDFKKIGDYYEEFPFVRDEEIVRLLKGFHYSHSHLTKGFGRESGA